MEANQIISDLGDRIGLATCSKEFNSVIGHALTMAWTRDQFDRLIVANAALDQSILLSKDRVIQANYEHAKW